MKKNYLEIFFGETKISRKKFQETKISRKKYNDKNIKEKILRKKIQEIFF